MYLTPLNHALKNGYGGKYCYVYFSTILKNKKTADKISPSNRNIWHEKISSAIVINKQPP